MALAESSRVRSGSATRATAVHAWCPRVPLRSAWSALRAASEDGTGGPLTKVIEYDAPSTHPGRGNARGARGGL